MTAARLDTVVGRYEIRRAIASGGMATVHLGRMRSGAGLGRTVALKRMHAHFATDPSFVAMFFDEARLAMRLQHPNIVPTFDVVSTEDELLLVMDYIHGESLAGLLCVDGIDVRIPPAIASSIACGVLAGLHAAHETRGEDGAPLEIVHRDVSPQNIIVGIDGVARLLDFGIAKAVGRVHSTMHGQLKGKFAYMAPEQLTNEEVDRRADVFAASVVLWEALTGRRLFRSETPGGLVHAVLTAEVPLPSSIAPDLPRAVDEVVLRGLARQRRERFSTAREMALALEAALAPATALVTGKWVETRGATALQKRSAMIEEEEGVARPGARTLEPYAPVVGEAASGTNEVPSVVELEDEVVGSGDAARTRRTLRWPWIAVIAALALGVAGGIVWTKVTASRPAPAEPPARATSSASSALPPAQAQAFAPAPPSALAPASGFPASRPRSRSRPASPAKLNCANPFVVDARGIRVPRPECF